MLSPPTSEPFLFKRAVGLLASSTGGRSLRRLPRTSRFRQALLHCAKNSMNMLKNRIQSRTAGPGVFLFAQKPFFEVSLDWLSIWHGVDQVASPGWWFTGELPRHPAALSSNSSAEGFTCLASSLAASS